MIDPSELQCFQSGVILFPAIRSYSGYNDRCLYVYHGPVSRAVQYAHVPDDIPITFREPTSLELIDALNKLKEVPDQDYNIRCALGIVEKYLYGKE